MAIKRVPVKSPIQIRRPAPVVPLPKLSRVAMDFSEVYHLIEQLTQLKDQVTTTTTSKIKELDTAIEYAYSLVPEKGDDADPVDEEAIVAEILRKIPIPKNGKDADETAIVASVLKKIPKVQTPKIPKIEHIVAQVLAQIQQPQDAEAPVIDHQELAGEVIAHIFEKKLLKTKHIDGLSETIDSYRNQLARGGGYVHGGGDTVAAGNGVTITTDSNGKKVISAPAAGTVYNEVLTDSGDHKNFTALHTITTIYSLQDGSGKGIPLKDASGSTNYTFTGATLTLASADANLASIGINIIYA